jgi:hypothetical protein
MSLKEVIRLRRAEAGIYHDAPGGEVSLKALVSPPYRFSRGKPRCREKSRPGNLLGATAVFQWILG